MGQVRQRDRAIKQPLSYDPASRIVGAEYVRQPFMAWATEDASMLQHGSLDDSLSAANDLAAASHDLGLCT